MNGEQQRKALNYTMIFLSKEIEEIKITIKKVNDPLTKPLLEKRLRELETDYNEFEKLSESELFV